MRRVWVVIASASLVAGLGCGRKSYQDRLDATLAKLDYDRRLRKNLMDPPADQKFKDLSIFIRAPKEEALAKTGQLPVSEGQFDLDASFNDAKEANATLHLLARVKMPKKPATKGAAPVAQPPARAEFISEVLGVLSTAFNAPQALESPKFSEESRKGGNRFKRLIFNAGDREVKLYIYKERSHEVALVFVYDPKDPKLKAQMGTKIEYCLDSFATGERAVRLYSGGTVEEEGDAPSPGPI